MIEGGDQVGKADATQNLLKALRKNIPITIVSFPMYSMPLGTAIRKMLKEGIEDIVKEKHIEASEEFKARMSMYALDRLMVTDCLLKDGYEDRLLIFDRSPYSNSLTIAYGLGGRDVISREKVDGFASFGFESEQFMIESLNLKNCVLELYDDSEDWVGSRSEGDDQYESKSVQEVCGDVYTSYAKKVGDGWCKLATKVDGEWRGRDEISEDILSFVYSRYLGLKEEGCENTDVEILELTEAVRGLYVGSCIKKEHFEALKKSLDENDKSTLYDNSISVVEDMLESMSEIKWSNLEARDASKGVLDVNPFCWDIIESFLGEKYCKLLEESLG